MKTYKISEIENKRILGRNVADAGKVDKPLALFWGGAALELCVKAREVWIDFSSEYQTYEAWVAVEINGSPISRFMIDNTGLNNSQRVCIARNLNPEKENLVSIIKDTQPMSGEQKHSLFINSVTLDDEGIFCPLKSRKCKIEFVGDSITSGEGLAGGVDEGEWICQWFSASRTYSRMVARKLDADWSLFSQCGWGISWGWDGDRNSCMPAHYDNVCSVMAGDYQKTIGAHEKYNFGKGSDFVVLNLGTNDNGAFYQKPWIDSNGVEYKLSLDENKKACKKDGDFVAQAVTSFLLNIRAKNPNAKIIWTWGMIKLEAIPEYIVQGIEAYKKQTGDNQVYSLELPSMEDVETCLEDKGSRGHPGPKTHILAAEKIASFIQSL
ncbi:MAG: GDSL-type esterase/lipase family protein [Treponema sp.]|nr:GDSL-type esterase/lipase family protein [Treponema sp.]